MSEGKKGDTVTSYNQSGAITAHTVNVGTVPRHVDQETRQAIRSSIPKSALVALGAAWGDAEALDYATEIYGFMKPTAARISRPTTCRERR